MSHGRHGTTMCQKEYREKRGLGAGRHPSHPVIAAYVIPKIKQAFRDIPVTRRTRLLDVGCGTGFFTYYFDRMCDTWGVDNSEELLSMNPVKKKLLMSAVNLAFPDDSFDVVFCHALLHHLEHFEDMGRVVREMRRVSRDYVVMLEPNIHNPFMFLFALLVREERNALRFSRAYFRQIAVRGGLSIVDSFSFGMTLPHRMRPWMLPLARLFDIRHLMGMTNVLIGRK